jgi:GLPGLI family protein
MKNIIFLFVTLIGLITNSQNTYGLATYGITRIDKEIPKEVSSVKKMIQLMDEGLKNVEYELKFNSIVSTYSYIEKLNLESDVIGTKLALTVAGGEGVKYVNLKSKEVLKQMLIGADYFIVKSSLNDLKWILLNQTKIIEGYLCYGAETEVDVELKMGVISKQKITAWYTPKIPASFGPNGFGGLGGLILELNTPKMKTFLKTLKLKTKSLLIQKPIKGKLVSPKEFREIQKKIIFNLKKGF